MRGRRVKNAWKSDRTFVYQEDDLVIDFLLGKKWKSIYLFYMVQVIQAKQQP